MIQIDFDHPEKYVGTIFKNNSMPELNAYYSMVRIPLPNGSKFFLIGLRAINVWSAVHPPWGVSSKAHWSLLPNNYTYSVVSKRPYDPMYNPEYTAPPQQELI